MSDNRTLARLMGMQDILEAIEREVLATIDPDDEVLLTDLRRLLLSPAGPGRCPEEMKKSRYASVRDAAVVLARGAPARAVLPELIRRHQEERAWLREQATVVWQARRHGCLELEVDAEDDEEGTCRPRPALTSRLGA